MMREPVVIESTSTAAPVWDDATARISNSGSDSASNASEVARGDDLSLGTPDREEHTRNAPAPRTLNDQVHPKPAQRAHRLPGNDA